MEVLKSIGDKELLCFEVGDVVDGCPEIRYINIWVNNMLITSYDNVAFVPGIISAAKSESIENRNILRFERFFNGLNVPEIHQYILEKRMKGDDSGVSDYDLFPEYQMLDWGPITDNIMCFIVPYHEKTYLTFQFIGNLEERNDKDVVYFKEITLDYLSERVDELITELSSLD
jgi:hypothetical protein